MDLDLTLRANVAELGKRRMKYGVLLPKRFLGLTHVCLPRLISHVRIGDLGYVRDVEDSC